ncbi:MAG: sulfite exporter TauE/SafE family protein [Planctomycetes bacterium]|nr:sulfite exporter TauE/SafE family protein [Planctomycetota bacterium]
MFEFFGFEFSYWQWGALALCGVLVGVSKTGLPGISIVTVGLMANLFEGKSSTGVLLPMLIFADVFAILYYRRHAEWAHILRLLPWALAGIGSGFFAMRVVDDEYFGVVIGSIVLVMLGVKFFQDWRNLKKGSVTVPTHWGFGAMLGFAAGVTTMMANAAGPVMTIYFLAMGFDKKKFVGTAAWFFFMVNWIKVPLSGKLDLITADTLRLDAMVFPFILLGVVVGIVFLKHVKQKWFNRAVMVIAVIAAVKLLLS